MDLRNFNLCLCQLWKNFSKKTTLSKDIGHERWLGRPFQRFLVLQEKTKRRGLTNELQLMECLKFDAFSLEGKIYLLNVFNDFHNVSSVTVRTLSLFLSQMFCKKYRTVNASQEKKHYDLITLHYKKFTYPRFSLKNRKIAL